MQPIADLFQPLSELPFETGEFVHVLPIAIPAIFGLVVLLFDLYVRRGKNKAPLVLLTAVAALLSALAALAIWQGNEEKVVMAGTLATSAFAAALALPILLGNTLIGFAVAHHGQPGAEAGEEGRHSLAHGELYGLMLFGSAGMLALLVANDLVTFFVAIETLSLAVYALTGADRRRARSAEGAMKYFVLGAFSSGFLLYGMSLLYGATGTLRLDELTRTAIPADALPLATTGGVLLLIGLLFKVGAVPFHGWLPDAYEGAPSPVTGFMSIGVKVAAFAGALRVIDALGAAGALGTSGIWVLWVIAGITVIAGNAGALTQRNPRRLLAYSGIAHTGYLMVGLVAMARSYDASHPSPGADLIWASKDAVAGMLFYLLAYGVANALSGLAQTHPWSALAMTISLVSLAGIPGTAGFLGKLWVFRAGVAAGDVGLVVLALVASAISLYYYLYVVVLMYMHGPQAGTAGASAPDPQRWCSRLSVGTAGVLVIVLGIYPTAWLISLMVNGAEALL
jgi:NADH-quinone oxidoreductase subunit N